MKNLISLRDFSASDKRIVGAKASTLHQLAIGGFNIPDSIFISSNLFNQLLEEQGLKELIKKLVRKLDGKTNNLSLVNDTSKNIQELVLQLNIPQDIISQINEEGKEFILGGIAIRSSAVFEDGTRNSWAGLFDSYLNIDVQDISKYIISCWASFFNSRALQYNLNPFLGDFFGFSVIVQKMSESIESGVAFSLHPDKNKFPDCMLIESTKGYGDTLVSGKVIPSSLIVGRKSGTIVKSQYQQEDLVLSISKLEGVYSVLLAIEQYLGFSVDLEWSYSNAGLDILQARPITAQKETNEIKHITVNSLLDIEIDNYEMTFKVSGIRFLFTDILARGFKYLNPLFYSVDNTFRQYFTNSKMRFAAEFGRDWLSKDTGFIEYQEDFQNFHNISDKKIHNILSKDSINEKDLITFINIAKEYFEFYSKMDFQFTDLTYLYSFENEVIAKNLELLSRFKDFARLWVNRLMIDEENYFMRILSKLSLQTKVDRDILLNYNVDEILGLVKNNINVSSEVVLSRADAFAVYISDGKISYESGDSVIDFAKKSIKDDLLEDQDLVIGQIANLTLDHESIQGKVVIINVDYENIDKMNRAMEDMEDNDILVAEFTAPELMVACKKARAIVTDLGGMLSHAAIVSRELNLPCVIGTQYATKVFKTGDYIIIDLKSGVVKKINQV